MDPSRSSRRGSYHKYTAKERAEIGKYSVEHGMSSAKNKFSRKLGINLCHSTIQGMKAAYVNEIARKRRHGEDLVVKELPQRADQFC